MDQNNFCERLRETEILLDKTPDEMSHLMNCSLSSYYRYRSGSTIPDLNAITKLYENLPQVNLNWLLSGSGAAILPGFEKKGIKVKHDGESLQFYNLPMYHMKTGKSDHEGKIWRADWGQPPEYFPICHSFIINMLNTDNHKGLFVITVECKSMVPVIQQGSVVIADHQLNDINNDGIFVVGFDDVIRLKVIQKLPGKRLQLSSINDAFKPIIVSTEGDQDINILGRIIWVGTPL